MPPVSTKQTTKPPPAKRPGSVLSQAVSVAEISDDYINLVVYGPNRVGKTTLACDFPKPLLLVAYEPNKTGGAASVKGVKGVQFLRLRTSTDSTNLARELGTENPFKTVVIDSATSLQDMILMEIAGLEKVPDMLTWQMFSRDQYRERSEKTREILRPFINLDCHTIITAKERDHNPQEKDKPTIIRGQAAESFFGPDLGGQTAGWLMDACDYIGHLSIQKEYKTKTVTVGKMVTEREVETGKLVRRLRTLYHPNYAAGFRASNPEAVPEFIDEPTYAKIKAVIEGGTVS